MVVRDLSWDDAMRSSHGLARSRPGSTFFAAAGNRSRAGCAIVQGTDLAYDVIECSRNVAMWDHVEFTVGSIEAARRFYRPVIEAIGFREVFFSQDDRAVGFGTSSTEQYLLLTEGKPIASKMHLCLTANGKDAVAAAYAAALSHGGRDNGAPGYRDHYAPGYYAAFVHDPDGHNLEFLYREPQEVDGRSGPA